VEVYRATQELFLRQSDQLTWELNLAVVFDVIEGDVDSRRLSVENGKLAAVGFPSERDDAFCKDGKTRDVRQGRRLFWETFKVPRRAFVFCYVLTLHLHHVDRNLLLSHAEDFKVGDNALKREGEKISCAIVFKVVFFHSEVSAVSPLSLYRGSFRSPVHFHTQVVSVSLPVQFAVDNIEEVADADLLAGGNLHQSHSRWDIFVLGYPERYDVVTRRPWEVPVGKHKNRAQIILNVSQFNKQLQETKS